MLYYDDRDYLDYNNIDELYDDEYLFDDDDNDEVRNSWEFDYHNIADELDDE